MKYPEEDKTSQVNTSGDSYSGSSIISTESLFSSSMFDSQFNNTNYFNTFRIKPREVDYLNNPNKYQSNKINLSCPALNQLNKNGSIEIIVKERKVFLSKIQQIKIEDNYSNLFDKGKHTLGNYFLFEDSIPNIYFWYKRYYYYSKFDEGIQMDFESWYSVTPEPISKYIANLVKGKTIIDGFCGCGGNVIQFSKQCKKVYAIDIDKSKLILCQNNCRIYKCKPNIHFIMSDFLKLKGKLPKADFVFLSPPWGGIEYKSSKAYDIHKLMTPNLYDIMRVSFSFAKKIIFYLPRNLILEDLYAIISNIKNEIENGSGNQLWFDVRVIKSNCKIKALIIIFGYELADIINENDMNDYLVRNYDYVNYDNMKLVWLISKMIGLNKFFVNEIEFKANCRLVNSYDYNTNINQLIKMFIGTVLGEDNKKSLERNYLNYGKMICKTYSNGYVCNYNYNHRSKSSKVI